MVRRTGNGEWRRNVRRTCDCKAGGNDAKWLKSLLFQQQSHRQRRLIYPLDRPRLLRMEQAIMTRTYVQHRDEYISFLSFDLLWYHVIKWFIPLLLCPLKFLSYSLYNAVIQSGHSFHSLLQCIRAHLHYMRIYV